MPSTAGVTENNLNACNSNIQNKNLLPNSVPSSQYQIPMQIEKSNVKNLYIYPIKSNLL